MVSQSEAGLLLIEVIEGENVAPVGSRGEPTGDAGYR
jgi:hypothetical protein